MARVRVEFRLSMPGRASWDGGWSGEGRNYSIVRSVDETAATALLRDGGTWGYSFGDAAHRRAGDRREPVVTGVEIVKLLRAQRFRYNDEADLQKGIAQALTAAGITFEREVILGPHDRLDFLVDGGICIEVKVAGSAGALLRQVFRYTNDDRVKEVVIVSNRPQHACIPLEIHGKPVNVIILLTGIL